MSEENQGIKALLEAYKKRNPPPKKHKEPSSEVEVLHLLARLILHRLEGQIAGHEHIGPLWDEDETALSVLVKVTQVLTKISELKKRDTPQTDSFSDFELSESDIERIRNYGRKLERLAAESPPSAYQE